MASRARRLAALGAFGVAAQELLAQRHYRTRPGPTELVHEGERTAMTPLWHEALAPLEWLALRVSATYRGVDVPRGDGAPVLLVSGFLTRGTYLGPFRDWLRRIGYRADIAPIGWNADCFDVLTDRLLDVVRRARATTGTPVHLIGHSLGGLLSRAAAARDRPDVASVTTLGSPIRGLAMHPALRLAATAVRNRIHAVRGGAVHDRCLTLACECPSVLAVRAPLSSDLPRLAIVTPYDGVADWRYGVETDEGATEVVTASHVGLVLSGAAYRAVARHLAAASCVRAGS
jgi:pimeloyl-ACP methyl ester carboxylesterase